MPNISNLKIGLQSNSDNTYYATWDFNETVKKPNPFSSGGGSLSVGDYVTIASGATYYNGVSVPSWVLDDVWRVDQIKGDRAVLGRNRSGTHNIQSPINVRYISNGSGSSGDFSDGSRSTITVKTNYLDHYLVKWYYGTGDGVSFIGSDSNEVKVKQSTYSAPSNAVVVKVSVKPVSKTYKVNNKDVHYWTGSWVSAKKPVSSNPPDKPSVPTVTIEKYKLTAKLENISDPKCDRVQFDVYKGSKRFKTSAVAVSACRATWSCTIDAGTDYRVRCRAINVYGSNKFHSDWSDFTDSLSTIPSAPSKILRLKAMSETSVFMDWENVKNATSYEVQYTTRKGYFDSSTEVQSMTVESVVGHAEITGLETGKEYFFRVRAVNAQGESKWSEIKSVIVGKKPSAPTTWSSTTTVIVGEPLTLYWVHNAEDGSSQTYAQLELIVNGTKTTETIQNTTDEDEKDKTSSYSIDTTAYAEGTTIQWRVRTAGITKKYGDWSVQRTVDVYAPATLEMEMTDVTGTPIDILTSFPFYISALAGPSTQAPIGYHLSVVSDERYETVDRLGNPMMVNAGDELYSKFFDVKQQLLVELSAGNIDLANNVSYTVKCTVSMDSGLTADASLQFTVDWTEVSYEPDAEIGVDLDTYSAYISPYCYDLDGNTVSDVYLSVYRREFDGTFTEIATNIDVYSNEYVIDPHPALDFARYRIVATSKTTGTVCFYDPPGYPVGVKSVIIQWDDEWSNFDAKTEDEIETPPWTGSLLELPYNIDVSDSNNRDITLVSYIGRSYPVSYYGTQIGSTATWNVTIDKDDVETLYALRRLAIWMGNVYVREPSGSGYWATVNVSFSQKHLELTIPVTLDVTRVEGGV